MLTLLSAFLFVVAPTSTHSIAVWDLNSLKFQAELNLDNRQRTWDELQAVCSVQGLVNRRRAQLYLNFVGNNGAVDQYWLKRLRTTWLAHTTVETIQTLDTAIRRFRSDIRGVVVWDERVPATSNVAATIAGVENLIPIRYDPRTGSLYRHLISEDGLHLPVVESLLRADHTSLFTGKGMIPGTNIPSSGSAKCDAYLWAADRFLKPGKCDPGWMGYYPDAAWLQRPNSVPLERTLLTNHDFFVAKKAFFFDLDPWEDEAPDDDMGQPIGTDAKTLKAILTAEYRLNRGRFAHVGGFTPWDQKYTDFTGRKHGGVETEWHYGEVLSCYNAFMDADAPGLHAMANASVYMHQPLKSRYPQPNRCTEASLTKRGYIRPDGTVQPKSYVTIYVGDYDSAAWLYTMMPQVWDDPNRGAFPLGWAFNPSLDARFPTGLVYARDTATANDFFISGDSGAGYLNPGYLNNDRKWSGLPSGLREWERLNRREFQRWDLGIVGFVIDGFAPAMDAATKEVYARFSPLGVVAQKVPPLTLVDGTPFLRMGSDLPHDNLESTAQIICRDASGQEPSFHIFRTILWTPTEHAALYKRVKSVRPDIEIVDPYTLMMLAKHVASRQFPRKRS